MSTVAGGWRAGGGWWQRLLPSCLYLFISLFCRGWWRRRLHRIHIINLGDRFCQYIFVHVRAPGGVGDFCCVGADDAR